MKTLKRKKDFNKVFNRGKSTASRFLVIYWYPNNKEINRYGFSISKRIGKAVVRNKLKRRLKEIIRRFLEDSCLTGYDIIIIARNPVNDLDFEGLKDDLTRLFKKADLFKNSGK